MVIAAACGLFAPTTQCCQQHPDDPLILWASLVDVVRRPIPQAGDRLRSLQPAIAWPRWLTGPASAVTIMAALPAAQNAYIGGHWAERNLVGRPLLAKLLLATKLQCLDWVS